MLRTLFTAEEVVRVQWVQPFLWEVQLRIPASRFQIAHFLLLMYIAAGILATILVLMVATLVMAVIGFAGLSVLKKFRDEDRVRSVAQTHYGYQLWRLLHLIVLVIATVVFVASFAFHTNEVLGNSNYEWTVYVNGERAFRALLMWIAGMCALLHNYVLICPPLPMFYRSIFK